MQLRLALVQANPMVGALARNLAIAKEHIVRNRSSDVVVFPESFLSGYPADDLVLNAGFMAELSRTIVDLMDFVRETAGPAVLIGAPEPGANLPFNAAHFIQPDGTRRIVRKLNLPNDGPFDERRTFAHGEERGPIEFRGFRIGVVICEEMWSAPICRRLSGDLADFLLVLNGSPYTRDKHAGARIAHARKRVHETGLPLAYLNLVGGQDELVFDGCSFVVSRDGRVDQAGGAFVEDGIVVVATKSDLEGPYSRAILDVERTVAPTVRRTVDEDASDVADYVAATMGLRDYAHKNGFGKVVLGISGGADSALAGAMAVDAFGAENVLGLSMPSSLTSDFEDSVAVARALGIELVTVPIADSVATFEKAYLELSGGSYGNAVTPENIQARCRMINLMAVSNDQGRMLVTTGNKSECSVGYSTLYGDMAGGFNPLKDLYKTEVWRLMDLRNRRGAALVEWQKGPVGEVVAPVAIRKTPTAGLAVGQTDEDRLGPYPVLDAFLRQIVDAEVGPVEAVRRVRDGEGRGWRSWSTRYADTQAWAERYLDEEYAVRISRLVAAAEYKRRQAAPGPKIGGRAFGRDRRYPIVNGWSGS